MSNRCMDNKGFTLVEIIAVLVIMAILAVIVLPIVSDLIDDSRDKADYTSAQGYLKAAEQYYNNELVANNGKQPNLDSINVIDYIGVTNPQGTGYVFINPTGDVYLKITIHNKCYYKTFYDETILVSTDLNECVYNAESGGEK